MNTTAELLREAGASMLQHPYTQRLVHRANASGDNRIYSPADVLGERLMRLGGMLFLEADRPGYSALPWKRESRAEALLQSAALAHNATPYLWTEETRAAVRDLEVPRHRLSPRFLVEPRTWHTFYTGIGLGGHLEVEGRSLSGATADCCLIADAQDHLLFLMWGEMTDAETGENVPCITGGRFEYGRVYPDEFTELEQNALHSPLVMMSFLSSPYIPKSKRRADRAARREAARRGATLEDDHVTFVVLRRPQQAKRDSDDEMDVHWRHRWIVRGHIRAQWYPTLGEHRLIWIAPHIKGPQDAPLLQHAYKVAQ